jgi:hypothetical protein
LVKDPRYLLGFLLVILLFGLAFAIALGKVEETSSFGLHDLLETLKILTAAFAGWAFAQQKPAP